MVVFDRAMAKRAFQVFFGLFLMVAAFFLSAGRLDLPRAWILYGLSFIQLIFNFVIFSRYAPGIIRERSEVKPGTRSWDIIFSIGYTASILAIHIVAGLDLGRFNWSYLGIEYLISGVVLYAIGTIIITWAMVANRFFETTVTIVKGHKVVNSGPYSVIRHPGYVGFILMYSSSCLVLGSSVSLIPAGILTILLIFRTFMEDKTLQNELEGYKDYTEKVRYRLVPGIW